MAANFKDFMNLALRERVDENERQMQMYKTWLKTIRCGKNLKDNFWTKKGEPMYQRWIRKKVATLVKHETAFINWTAIETLLTTTGEAQLHTVQIV